MYLASYFNALMFLQAYGTLQKHSKDKLCHYLQMFCSYKKYYHFEMFAIYNLCKQYLTKNNALQSNNYCDAQQNSEVHDICIAIDKLIEFRFCTLSIVKRFKLIKLYFPFYHCIIYAVLIVAIPCVFYVVVELIIILQNARL